MKTYIKAGIKDLPSMINHYNSFSDGGPKKTYQQWVSAMASKYPWLELNSANAGYDYERYFNENYQDAISRLSESEPRHFEDTYKLPSHITFSDESVYSTPRNKGGRWIGDDLFIPSPANVERYPWLYKAYKPVREEDIYSHKFEKGGPEEELYSAGTLPEVAITASRIYDKDFEKTYKKYGKYAGISNKSQAYHRWLDDQGKLDTVKARRSEASRRALGVTAAGASLPFATAGAVKAAPYVLKSLDVVANPFQNTAKLFKAGDTATGLAKIGDVGYNIYGSAKSLAHLYSKNGLQKTINLIQKGDTKNAIKSGAGDLLDLLGGLYLYANTATKGVKWMRDYKNAKNWYGLKDSKNILRYAWNKIPAIGRPKYNLANIDDYLRIQAERMGYAPTDYKPLSYEELLDKNINFLREMPSSDGKPLTPEKVLEKAKAITTQRISGGGSYHPVYKDIALDYVLPTESNFKINIGNKTISIPNSKIKALNKEIVDNTIGAHEMVHSMNDTRGFLKFKPSVPEGMSFNHLPSDVQGYLTSFNGTESNARAAQLLNWFGIRNKNTLITPEMLKYAKWNYLRRGGHGGMDNNMFQWLGGIEDYDAFSHWMNTNIGVKFDKGGKLKKK